MKILYGDLETYSEVPIKHGTYKYAENAEIMIFAYAFDDGPVHVWDLTTGESMPPELADALESKDTLFMFQNSMFDRSVFRLAQNSHPLMRIVGAERERWRDTMVQALAHSLPGGLEKVGDILKIDQDKKKLATGKNLIQLFCKPRPKNSKIRRATRHTHPVEWAQFVEYAKMDIEAMREIHRKLPVWNYEGDELALWHLDQQINDRGVCIDLDLVRGAITAVAKEQKRLAKRTQELTDGQVESATKRDKLLLHILEYYGVDLPDMKSDTLERRMQDPDLPPLLHELLGLRLSASSTSTSKYNALMRGVSSDGRLRGTLQFNGANRTGRWAGRTFQPQNLPRPNMPANEIKQGIEAIKADAAHLVYADTMALCVNAIRGCIIAPPDKKLVVADLANIEGRMAAWLAGESWKLDAFRAYDDGTGPDLYKLAYAKAFGIYHADVSKDQRQIGKVMELMLQYEGGVGAFLTGALTYGIDLDAMAEAALPTIPADVLTEAKEFYAWSVKKKRSTFGLAEEAFLACDALKRLWRRAHPAISTYWPELKDRAIEAISNPGNTITCRRLKLRRDGAWLRILLPSGRALCYPSPRVGDDGRISYMGVDQYTRKWQRVYTTGMFAAITQAASRDVMAANMPVVESLGYEIVLTVHDEVLTEAPDRREYDVRHLSAALAHIPVWAKDLPLAAAGFEGYRYRKD